MAFRIALILLDYCESSIKVFENVSKRGNVRAALQGPKVSTISAALPDAQTHTRNPSLCLHLMSYVMILS